MAEAETPGTRASASGRAPPGEPRRSRVAGEAIARAGDPQALPIDKLRLPESPESTPGLVALLSCGSFNPITNQHLRMMSLAKRHLEQAGKHVVGGYLSPVGDDYKKPGLETARRRVEMTRLATVSSPYMMVDAWEALQPEYVRTCLVLRSIQEELNLALRDMGWTGADASVVLVCGADLLQSFVMPGVWLPDLLRDLLHNFKIVCVARQGIEAEDLLSQEGTVVHEFRGNIEVIHDPFTNIISSSKVREELSEGRTVEYIIPQSVIEFIYENHLYRSHNKGCI